MAKKPTRSFYHSHIQAALQAHARMPLRAEGHEAYLDLFTDHKQLNGIEENPDWQIIAGRRGSGKTLLMNVIRERFEKALDTHKVVPLLFCAQDFHVSPPRTATDNERALAYFQTFMEQLCNRLIDFATQRIIENKNLMLSLFGLGSRKKVAEIENVLLGMMESTEKGELRRAYMSTEVSTTRTKVGTQVVGSSIGGVAEVDLAGVSAGAAASATVGVHDRSELSTVTRETGEPTPRLFPVKPAIVRTLDVLGMERLLIMIDEFQALDASAATAVQPVFAELLKRAFVGTPRISIKIAGNPYQLRLSNGLRGSRFQGLQLNADIFEATNLDHALLGDENLHKFYERLLFKRLCYKNPALRVFETEENRLDEQFILSIFRTIRGFRELVSAAGGLPRDFLLAFNNVARKQQFSVETTWATRAVQDVIVEQSVIGKQEDINYRSPAQHLLMACIRPIIERTNSRLFAIARSDIGHVHEALDELLEKRLISEWPIQFIDPVVRPDYDIYSLDYGVCLDWQRALFESPKQIGVPKLSKRTISLYTLKVGAMKGLFENCDKCDHEFVKTAPAFAKKGLCPACFEVVAADSSGT